jgi:hypothetical protein
VLVALMLIAVVNSAILEPNWAYYTVTVSTSVAISNIATTTDIIGRSVTEIVTNVASIATGGTR